MKTSISPFNSQKRKTQVGCLPWFQYIWTIYFQKQKIINYFSTPFSSKPSLFFNRSSYIFLYFLSTSSKFGFINAGSLIIFESFSNSESWFRKEVFVCQKTWDIDSCICIFSRVLRREYKLVNSFFHLVHFFFHLRSLRQKPVLFEPVVFCSNIFRHFEVVAHLGC